MAGGRLQARIDQGLAGHLVLFLKEADGCVHGVLGPSANDNALGICVQSAPFHPASGSLTMDQGLAGARVVEQAGCLDGAELLREGRQIAIPGSDGRHVEGEVDDAPLRAVLEGEQRGLRGNAQHVGASAHLTPHQAPPRGLTVGSGDGADVQTQQVCQESMGRQGIAGAQLPHSDGIPNGLNDSEVGGLVGFGQFWDPNCHAHNLRFPAHKITHRKATAHRRILNSVLEVSCPPSCATVRAWN